VVEAGLRLVRTVFALIVSERGVCCQYRVELQANCHSVRLLADSVAVYQGLEKSTYVGSAVVRNVSRVARVARRAGEREPSLARFATCRNPQLVE